MLGMADFYSDIRTKSASLHARYAQGDVTLTRTVTGEPDPETPWEPGPEVTTTYALDAVVQGAGTKFIDNTTIIASDLQVQFSPLARWTLTDGEPASGETVTIIPAMTDTITVNGAARTPKRILSIPASGDAVAFIVFVAS